MLINTSLPPESTAADLQNNRATAASAQPAKPGLPVTTASDPAAPALELLRGLSLPGQEGDSGIPDSTAADQATHFARTQILDPSGLAMTAQANLNPESVFNLLQ